MQTVELFAALNIIWKKVGDTILNPCRIFCATAYQKKLL